MRRHLARLFERALVLEVGRDASATEGVIAHLGGDASRLGPPHHLSGVAPMQPLAVEFHAGHRSCSVAALHPITGWLASGSLSISFGIVAHNLVWPVRPKFYRVRGRSGCKPRRGT